MAKIQSNDRFGFKESFTTRVGSEIFAAIPYPRQQIEIGFEMFGYYALYSRG
jgi:hypothetical protein